ncbi:hypothetical protein ACIBCN_18725 [Nocardia sp. NPDC051052]|uniref:hypothetical protein n=1 Tax=Nocardia sp. NPDC051052 TaxID=3364322 RepID=UPI0037A58DC7
MSERPPRTPEWTFRGLRELVRAERRAAELEDQGFFPAAGKPHETLAEMIELFDDLDKALTGGAALPEPWQPRPDQSTTT